MSDRKPIYVGRDPSSGIVSGLTEFKTGDTVPLEHGGTGVTSLGALSSLLGIPELYTPNDHGSLDGLGDDDHPQYVLSATNADLSSSVLGVSSTVFDNSASWTGGGGVTDHGALTGLADDDHPQYVLSATNLALSSAVSTLEGELDGVSSTVFDNSASWGGAGVTDHGALTGLADDDHPQYVLSATNQTLSSTVTTLETELDGVSSTVFDNSASWAVDTDTTDHTALTNIGTRSHAELDGLFTSVSTTSGTWDQTATDLDTHEASATVHFTEASIDHGSIAGLGDNDHPQYVLSATNQTLSSTVSTLETELDGVSSTVFDNSASWGTDTDTTDHTLLSNIGTRTHSELDGLFTSVSTTSGTWDQTATDLDTHEADATIHFTEASIDHGSIAGLADDDHPQYVLSATNLALSSAVSTLETELDGVSSTVFDNSASWTGGGGVTDHGALTGLADDDHPQYVLSATNQTLSSTVSTLEGELDGVSSTVFDNSAAWAVDTDTTDHTALSNIGTRTHAELDSLYTSVNSTSGTWDQTATDLDSHEASAAVHFTEASIDHGSIAGLGDNDHPQYVLSATNLALSSAVTTLEGELDGVSSTVFDNSGAWGTDTDTTDHTALTNIGTRTHAELDSLYTSVNTTSGTWDQTATDLDTHEADSTIHFTEASIDHGSIAGLADNDHPQYVLSATNLALSSAVTTLEGELDGVSSTVFDNSAAWGTDTDTTDHTALTNIGTRTHPELDGLYTSVLDNSATWDTVTTVSGDLDTLEVTVAGATAIINAMSAALDGVSATVFDSSGGWEIETKAITIESPTSTEDISMFFTDVAITVEKMTAVLRGSATPSVTWTIRHGSDRSAAGTEVVTGGTATTNTTTGDTVTSFNDATIPANSFVWLETTAQSGTVNEINITIKYGLD
jgi:hypothetical protein